MASGDCEGAGFRPLSAEAVVAAAVVVVVVSSGSGFLGSCWFAAAAAVALAAFRQVLQYYNRLSGASQPSNGDFAAKHYIPCSSTPGAPNKRYIKL